MKSIVNLFFTLLIGSMSIAQTVELQRASDLMPEGYSITGTGYLEELSNGDLQFRLSDDFDTPAGPDVRVILNNTLSSSGGFEVVNLSSINHFDGALTIDLPSSIDIEDYDFVLFFCVAFNQFWASGEFDDTVDLSAPTCDMSEVEADTGPSIIDICPSDNSLDIINFENSLGLSAGASYAYLITDDNEVLEEVVLEDEFDFEGSSSETQRVYGIQYEGTLNEMIGSNRLLTTATDCFEHSDDDIYITVTKNGCFVCQDSDVSNAFGNDNLDICSTDNVADWVEFSNTLNVDNADEYIYLITDQNQILQTVLFDNIFDFEGSGDNEQRVYGMHYNGTLNTAIGSHRTSTTASGCFEHSSSNDFITVTKNACIPPFECLANQTSTLGGGTIVDICSDDGVDDIITLENNINVLPGDNYAFLITDNNEVLQEVVLSDTYNFEGSSDDEQRVYGMHYDGALLFQIGQDRMMTTANGCFTHSDSNEYLTITKNACPPTFQCLSNAVSSGGLATVELCATDGIPDIVDFNNSINVGAGDHYAYLLTDTNDILLEVVNSDNYNFEGVSEAMLRVYGIHFNDLLIPQIGENRLMTSASGCFTHSDAMTFLTVTTIDCEVPDECLESTTFLTDQSTFVDICSSDGIDDVLMFSNNLSLSDDEKYAYIIADSNEIVQFITQDNFFNFEGTTLEEQRVYGVHYTGVLNFFSGTHRTAITSSGCYEHSQADSYITITKNACPPPFECLDSETTTDSGMASLSICTSDGIDDIIGLNNSLVLNDAMHYAYLVTDVNEVLQFVTTDNTINLEGTMIDEIRIYGIHFNGTLNAVIGQNRQMTTATDCFIHSSASAFITVTTEDCSEPFECLESLTATTDWLTVVDICPNDGIDDLVELRNNLFIPPGLHYAYLITDESEIVQAVSFENSYDFEGSGDEVQRVYGVHFDGTLQPQIGAHRMMTTATGCYMHSGGTLFLTVNKDACTSPFECVESLTATTAWVTEVDVCATDGEDDIVLLQNNINTPPGENYAFLLTDEFENLQEVILDSLYNFENTGTEEQRVYGISYSGTLQSVIGQNRKNTTASECFIHSGDNLFIRINKTAGCGVSSTDDLASPDDIIVYPNPSNGHVNFKFSSEIVDFSQIEIYNAKGQRIDTVQMSEDVFITASGLYILRFISKEQNVIKRIIIK